MTKRFTKGEEIEIQREVDTAWEPARYVGISWKGWHMVQLPKGQERRISAKTGVECDESDRHGFLVNKLVVPSRRIRSVTA